MQDKKNAHMQTHNLRLCKFSHWARQGADTFFNDSSSHIPCRKRRVCMQETVQEMSNFEITKKAYLHFEKYPCLSVRTAR